MENKSPNVKIQTALFLSRYMVTLKKDNVPKKVLKTLTSSLIKVNNILNQIESEIGISLLSLYVIFFVLSEQDWIGGKCFWVIPYEISES